jgi:hypothetical protein
MPTILPFGSPLDIVGVFDDSFNQVFAEARPVRAFPRPSARLMDHPLETGQIVSDYKVILPVELQMELILPSPFSRDLYAEIWQLWQQSELLTVQTKASSYPNMIIAEIPHEETPEKYDALPMTIRFRQVQVVTSVTSYAPADPTQANTQNLGNQNAYTVNYATNPDGTLDLSSIPPQQPAYTLNGVQTIGGTSALPASSSPFSTSAPEISGVQSMVSQQTIGAGFNQ